MAGSKGRVRGSLKARVLVSCLASITLVLAAMGALQYANQRRKLDAALASTIESSAHRLEKNLAAPLWNVTSSDAADVLLAEMLVEDVTAIVVNDADGTLFAAAARKEGAPVVVKEAPQIPAGVLTREVVVRRDDKEIGKAVIVYGRDRLAAALQAELLRTLAQIAILDAVLALVLALIVNRFVGAPLSQLTVEAGRLAEAVRAGRLAERGDPGRLAPEFQPVLVGMNDTMDAYARPMALTARFVEAIARGELPKRIDEEFNGDFRLIRDSLNSLIDMVTRRARDLDALIQAALDGRLDHRLDPGAYQGSDARVMAGINQVLDALVAPLKVSASYVARIAKGDIPEKITAEYRGDFDLLKRNLNVCIDAVNALVSDANALSSAAVAGRLDVRADASRHEGDFRAIVQGVNDAIEAIVTPFRVVAEYCERISHGDIPPRRTNQVQGDIVAMQDSLNRCLDALARMVSDVNGLVEAAGEGRLDARAELGRHEGAFREALDGVNRTLDAVIAPVNEATRILGRLAERDLRARVEAAYRGDHARIKDSVNATATALNDALAQVAQSVDQVSSAATQIASSSQAVASGASEQASSLEETTASIESFAGMTRQTAGSAQQANQLAQAARTAATEGSSAVEQMQSAMGKIRRSAEGTSQIIKDINDIAFQTNLLALNAAVEAARAGEAGRGFAVVAEEVRSLALRAKEAATKTEELIRQSIREAGEGEASAKQVTAKLAEIAGGVSKVTDIVAEIAAAAREQSAGIEAVTRAVGEMDRVTQQNAASAEESSSAASELSGQAEDLAAMVAEFQLASHAEASVPNAARAGHAPRGNPGHAGGERASSSGYPGPSTLVIRARSDDASNGF
jgi:methyl-accepting chemotaxis protein